MKIINNTSLNYTTIGSIIDNILSITKGTTHYIGQIEWTILEINGHKIKIQITCKVPTLVILIKEFLKSLVEKKNNEILFSLTLADAKL